MSLDIWLTATRETTVYDANITHNLGAMAKEAGIYDCLWNGQNTRAIELINPLKIAIEDMKTNPEKYKIHDASNGWGTYKDFLPWLERLLNACIENPDATISISK